MNRTKTQIPSKQEVRSLLKALLFTGLLAGTLDILAAIIYFLLSGGDDPTKILVYIASGVFGSNAYESDSIIPMFAWGLVFHYLIAFGWTALFFWVYPKFDIFSINKYLNGIGYGIFVWLIMNLIVVPLSNTPEMPFDVAKALSGVGILIVAIGLPISLLAHRYYKN